MPRAAITIKDIARELNVSASTVSRALRDHPRISQATRKAVQELAKKHNYRPDGIASSLRSGQSKTVGVIIPRINRNFFSNVIGGMEEMLAESGYHLIICQTHEREASEIEAIHTLINARVNAILVSMSMETRSKAHFELVRDRGIRLMFFDRKPDNFPIASVSIDDRTGAYENVRHLISQGYQRICHLAGAAHIGIYRARQQGYIDAMEEAGLEIRPEWILNEDLVVKGGEAAFSSLMHQADRPDAFFCAGDYAALGVLQAARSARVRVPEDLGISGFANEPFTAYVSPGLTTVDQRANRMGQTISRMLLDCIGKEKKTTECAPVVLAPKLIVRGSTTRLIQDT